MRSRYRPSREDEHSEPSSKRGATLTSRPPYTVFVMSGGANFGALQLGMLRALFEAGIYPDAFTGTSAGALNAVFVAYRPDAARVEEFIDVWSTLTGVELFGDDRVRRVIRMLRRHPGVYSGAPLTASIKKWCPVDDLGDLAVPVHIVACELASGRAKWFDSGPAVDILRASAAIPGALPPVMIDGTLYTDGGSIDSVPISKAGAIGGTRLIVCDVTDRHRESTAVPQSAVEVLWAAFSASRRARIELDLAALSDDVEVMWMPAPLVDGIKFTDFTHSARLVEEAYQLGKDYLDAYTEQSAAALVESSEASEPTGWRQRRKAQRELITPS